MTAKQRIKRLEKNAPKDTPKANPYAAMSDAQLLDITKNALESGEPMTEDIRRQCETILQNNGIEWTVKHDNK